jgi:hypothetical protein
VSCHFEMGMRWIPRQLSYLTLAVFAVSSVATADCPETMRPNLSGPCIKNRFFFPSGYGSITGLRLTNLWQLDAGSVHPPLRLTHLKIERLVMESLWGLHPGESVIGDPRWGADKRHPDLDDIAFLRIREIAMTSRYARK